MSGALRGDARDGRVVLAQWVAVLGPPVLWAIRFMLSYALMPLACAADALIFFHVGSAISIAILLGLGWLARGFWRLGHDVPPADMTEPLRRTRFMGLFGMLSAALFAVVVIAESVANVMIDPCLVAGPLVPH